VQRLSFGVIVSDKKTNPLPSKRVTGQNGMDTMVRTKWYGQ